MTSDQSAADKNPYRSPEAVLSDFVPEADEKLRADLRRFRKQMRAAGMGWIALGLVAMIVGALLMFAASRIPQQEDYMLQLCLGWLVACTVWMLLGVCTCGNQIWAVYIVLGLSYLSVVGMLVVAAMSAGKLQLLIVMLPAFFAIIIVQGHRLIGIARRLRAAGARI